jgi:predicted aspartyl protease
MDNVTFVLDKDGNEHAIIDHGNEQFTSMPKSIYDELKANEAQAI